MRRRILLIAVVLAVLSGAAFWLLRIRKGGPGTEVPGEGGNPAPAEEEVKLAPVPVKVEHAFVGDLVIRIGATGRTRARRSVTIQPYRGGLLTRVAVRDGERVRKGELLFQLDDREARLAVQQARDEMLQAEVEYGLMRKEGAGSALAVDSSATAAVQFMSGEQFKRIEADYRAGKVPQPDYERARIEYEIGQVFSGSRRDELMAVKSGLAAALVKLRNAELELDYTRIRAPFSGVVGQVRVSPGQWVSASQPLCQLVDLSRLYFDAEVLESEIGMVRPGTATLVYFPAYADTVFAGRVVGINPVLDEESRTCTVVVEVPNPEGRLLDGMYGEAKLEAQVLPDRLLVPRRAVLERDRRKLVFIVRKNAEGQDVAQWCYVTVGRENEQFAEIVDSAFDLKPGEPVVVEGHFTLSHDAPVRVVE